MCNYTKSALFHLANLTQHNAKVIHVIACVNIFLWLKSIPQYKCAFCSLVPSSVDGLCVCFHLLVILNSVAVNTERTVSV